MPATSMYPLDDAERKAVDRRLRDRVLDFQVLNWLVGGLWISRETLRTLSRPAGKEMDHAEKVLDEWLARASKRGLVEARAGAGATRYRITNKGRARRNWLAHDASLNGQDAAHHHRRRRLFGRS